MEYYVTCSLSRPPKGDEINAVPPGAGIWCGRIKKTVDAEDHKEASEIGKAAIEHDCRGAYKPWEFGVVEKTFADKEDTDVYSGMHECSRLFILRNWREMSQKQLADAAGIPYRTVQKYENGEAAPENMTLGMARKIARALEVTIDDII